MRIGEIFQRDVTRDIPAVVYFHEQSAKLLADEVGEYIITGGYPKTDPRHERVPDGIHEQYVRLLRAMSRELAKPRGPELPNAWISGFYGSGKSIFAKLLGLALDGAELPDGRPLADALLARDESPRAAELVAAWKALRSKVDPMAVVFDIGGVARDDEHIHSAVLRQIQARLGYCPTSNLVAEHELKLERDGVWPAFEAATQQLGRPWDELKTTQRADDHFSHALYLMDPERYQDPLSWIDSRAGQGGTGGLSARECCAAIEAMLKLRAPGKTLFIVVDEVSQYVHQSDERMVRLQSFASELGARLHGAVWLLVTGQEKLEDDGTSVHKLKDRFPERLRVHLAASNIRDVIHRRLLQKNADREGPLREQFQRFRNDLELYAYGCAGVGEEDFVETYPMLPGQVDLLLQITSAVRRSSRRVQGDQYAIRGLLQLLGELFRRQNLVDEELGGLITLDAIYEVQHTALDSELQLSMQRVLAHCAKDGDEIAARAARAVALLQYIQEQEPTTGKLVASCLYERMGSATSPKQVADALQRLRSANLVGYSEKHGYKIQSSAGEEWQRERSDFTVSAAEISELVQERLKLLIATPDKPRHKSRPFGWLSRFSDGRSANDVRLDKSRDEAVVYPDFRFLKRDQRTPSEWVRRSAEELKDRLVWVAGERRVLEETARGLQRSRRMLNRYRPLRESLPREKQRLLFEEEAREEDLDRDLKNAVDAAWIDGTMYFRGGRINPRDHGSAFAPALKGAAEHVLPKLYPHFEPTAVTDKELAQLLHKKLAGPSSKFFDLGILDMDGGQYVATCAGHVPARILLHIEEHNGCPGTELFTEFGGPPYGYAPDLIRACVAGLLRGGKVRIEPDEGHRLTSIIDPGVTDLFRKDTPLRRANIYPAGKGPISGRDRVSICRAFQEHLGVSVARDNEAIADAVYSQFPSRAHRVRELEKRFRRLPEGATFPRALTELGRALDDCRRSRMVEDTAVAVKDNLNVIVDGLQALVRLEAELTDEAVTKVQRVASVVAHHVAQLKAIGSHGEELAAAMAQLAQQLTGERPWQGVGAVEPSLVQVLTEYRAVRTALLVRHEERAEGARDQVKRRKGVELLTGSQHHDVLRPLTKALFETTPDAIAPSLQQLRDGFDARLRKALEEANELLDEILWDIRDRRFAKVRTSYLVGTEIEDKEQLAAVLADLRRQVEEHLKAKRYVRFV